ncbi:MAG: PH domain-containing protein [Chloroflexi bacterium]|nr:PH domain-containing protein [Chloroflexota bacterium]
MTRRFDPKCDWWLLAFLIVLLLLVTVIVFFSRERQLWAVVLVLFLDIMTLWILFGSWYALTATHLAVAFGPIRFHFPLEHVVRVRRGGLWAQVTSFREPRLRFAFSADNIVVELSQGWASRVVISPRDKEAFVALLRERVPNLVVEL